MKEQKVRISLKLDTRLAVQIERIRQVENRTWRGQTEWFLDVFSEVLVEGKQFRPMPRRLPADLKQNYYTKIFLPQGQFQGFQRVGRQEHLSAPELVRQCLWVGVEHWQELNLPGVRKEFFVEFILSKLRKPA